MDRKIKARVMDRSKIRRVLVRIATEIIERNRNLKNVVIVGIKTRGIFIGKRIARLIHELEGVDVPVAALDITCYRDDLPAKCGPAKARRSRPGLDIRKKDVILVDDVLMTGRTIRAAMDGLMDMGRPKTVQLLVLIDRGHRELPIRPDYAGKVLPTSRRELIRVRLKEMDGADEVLITEPTAIR
jgi:pyrimidine operon attenuation protein/uracil phosphoribosyltransferase